jgi:hypothetical protein
VDAREQRILDYLKAGRFKSYLEMSLDLKESIAYLKLTSVRLVEAGLLAKLPANVRPRLSTRYAPARQR